MTRARPPQPRPSRATTPAHGIGLFVRDLSLRLDDREYLHLDAAVRQGTQISGYPNIFGTRISE